MISHLVVGVGAYALSVFTWPHLSHFFLQFGSHPIDTINDQIKALEALKDKISGKTPPAAPLTGA